MVTYSALFTIFQFPFPCLSNIPLTATKQFFCGKNKAINTIKGFLRSIKISGVNWLIFIFFITMNNYNKAGLR